MKSIDALRNGDGYFSMVAVDQRGSLRHMLANGRSADTVTDDELVEFKREVSEVLTPDASALLIDREFGAAAASQAKCPVILAADVLTSSRPGGPVDRAALDYDLSAEFIEQFGAFALKMLVPWQSDRRTKSIELSHEFMELCRRLEMPGVVEGVVRPPDIADWTPQMRNEALVEAARDLATTGPDLYKTEVVYTSAEHFEGARAASAGISECIGVPWVILSSGVPGALFADALRAAVDGGASGFLAGRALWADATTAENRAETLQTLSRERLAALSAVLAAAGRPAAAQ